MLPKMIWNIDETTTVVSAPKVVAETGLKRVGQISSAERGSLVTMIAYANAAGGSIPPVFIFPRVHFKPHMLQGGPHGALGLALQSGWVTEDCFLEALKHFVVEAKPSKEEPALIIFDNHKTHITINIILFARENHLIMLTLPPHCSHRLQPLDVTVFGPLKSRNRAAINDWMTSNPGKCVSIYDAKDAYYSAFNMHNITPGFKNTGIYPLNTNIFTDDDFLPSAVTDRPLATNSINISDNPTNVQECSGLISSEIMIDNQTLDASLPLAPSVVVEPLPININNDADVVSRHSQLSTSTVSLINTLDDPQPSTSTVLSPEIVRPFPKAMPRKKIHSARNITTKVITSTPEKDRLLAESLANMINKKQHIQDQTCVKKNFKSMLSADATKSKVKGPTRKSYNKNKGQKQKKIIESSSESDQVNSDVENSYSESDDEPLHRL